MVKPLRRGPIGRGRRLAQMILCNLTPADIWETHGDVRVQLPLPGHDPRSIQVRASDRLLHISSERRMDGPLSGRVLHGIEQRLLRMSRSISLPRGIDVTRAEARFENGVLRVTLPKREDARAAGVEIKVGGLVTIEEAKSRDHAAA